jgi:hypothetical protein
MHFLPRRRPLELDAQRVRSLRPSLNTPVVETAELPVGPACAAILVHVEPGHGLQINVGVRSLASGSVALYGFDDALTASVASVALDAALSFAESMGFLFDDDVVSDDSGSREKAVERWLEMIGDAVPGVTAETATTAPDDLFDADGGELTDPPTGEQDALEPDAEFGEVFERSGPDAAGLEPGPEGELALSKFRVPPESEAGAAAAGDAPARSPRKRPLGRLRLVKRRSGEPVQDAQRAWLLRLLTSF